MKAFLRTNKSVLLLLLLYLIPAIFWCLFSDNWLFTTNPLPEVARFERFDTIKDTIFVITTGIVFFFMIRQYGKKLKYTNAQYQKFFYTHPNPMWLVDMATLHFVAVNQAAIRHYGYSYGEFLQMSPRDIRPEEEGADVVDYINNLETGIEHSRIWRHKKKNGEIILVQVTANSVEFEKKKCWLVSVTDITEKTKKDEEIIKLSFVAENATNSVLIIDSKGCIEWANNAFTNLTGYTLKEVKGLRPQDFLHGPETDPETRAEIIRCIKERCAFSGEILNYAKDGSSYWLRLSISPVFVDGKVVNYVAIQTDITAIKWQIKYLREIAFTTSHNFRKPLANIIGLINVLELENKGKEEFRLLKQSAEALDEQVRLIADKMARIESLRRNPS